MTEWWGELLNTVERPRGRCPACGRAERLRVYELVAVWECGRVQALPRMPKRATIRAARAGHSGRSGR